MPPGPPGLPGPWGVPPKKRSPLPWILGGGGGLVVIIVIVVVLVVTLGGGSSPQAVAQQAVDILNSGNYQGLADVSCQKDKAEIQKETQNFDPSQQLSQIPGLPDDMKNIKPKFSVNSVTKDSDSHATATIGLAWTNVPADIPPEAQAAFTKPQSFPVDVIKESGDWKLCDLGQSQQGN